MPRKQRASAPLKTPHIRSTVRKSAAPLPLSPPAVEKRSQSDCEGTQTRVKAQIATVDKQPRRRRKARDVLSWWYAIRTKSGRERYARKMVEQRGHKVWAPFVYEEGAKRDQPLFPGHIFVLGPDWYYLRKCPGVLQVIMMGDAPARMPKAEMKRLMSSADKHGTITIKKQKFHAGQSIRVRRGSWQGHQGVYIRATGPERVRVLMSMLGGLHEFEFEHAAITAEDAPETVGTNPTEVRRLP